MALDEYTEVGWQNAPSLSTALNATNLNHMDDQIKKVTDTVRGIEIPVSFNLGAASWAANTDVSTATDYPYVYSVVTERYNNNSAPLWDLGGAGDVPTATERESIDMVLVAVFSTTGIKLYATDRPTVALVLRVKGV